MAQVSTLLLGRAAIRIPDQPVLDQVDTMATVTIEVPDEAFAALRRSPQQIGQEMRLAAAMLWYTQGRISHEKAASLAGVSRLDFIDALAAAKLPAFQVDVDELVEELELVPYGVWRRPAPRHLLRRRAAIGPHGPVPDPLAGDVEPEAPLAAVDGQPAARAVAACGLVPERQCDAMGLGRRAIGVERPAAGGIGARHDPA
jgi:predicted HTH domain antitoxin